MTEEQGDDALLPAVRTAPEASAIATTVVSDALTHTKDKATWHVKHLHKDVGKLCKNAFWGAEELLPRYLSYVLAHEHKEDAKLARAAGSPSVAQKAEKSRRLWFGVRFAILFLLPVVLMIVAYGKYGWLALAVVTLLSFVTLAVVGAKLTGETVIERATIQREEWWTENALNKALRNVGALPKGDKNIPQSDWPSVRIVVFPVKVDEGREVRFILPQESNLTATQLMQLDEKLAAQFNVATPQVVIDRGNTEAEAVLWVADVNPMESAEIRKTPLLLEKRTSIWQEAVIGRDARKREVSISLLWTQIIVGGLQGMGKTTLARMLLGYGLLDPYCDLYVLNFKGGNDYRKRMRDVVRGFVNGSDEEHMRKALHILHNINNERKRRFLIIEENEEDFPEGKITPESAEKHGFKPMIVLLDEIQEAFAALHGTPEYKELESLLQSILRLGRALGIVPIVVTQRPDDLSLPAKLKGLFGTRIALHCSDRQSSENLLGQGASARGDNAAKLPRIPGWSILVLGGHTGVTTKLDDMSTSEFESLIERGIQLRAAANVHDVNEEDDVPEDLVETARMILEAHEGAIAPADMLLRLQNANPALWGELTMHKLGREMKTAGMHSQDRNGVKYVLER